MTGNLPAQWSWASFSAVARIAANLVDPAGLSDLPHIAPDNIQRDTGRLLAYRTVGKDGMKSAKHRFYPGQLLYSKIRPYLNKCVRIDFDGLCSADMYPIDSLVEPRFLHQYMLTRQFVSAVNEAAGSRTVLPKTNQKQLANVPVPIAPQAEQHRIVSALESYFTRLDVAVTTLERVQRNLKRYRASVLKAAVEGKLVSTEAELARAEGRTYEPASVLLTRILAERRRRWEEAELAKMKAEGRAPKDDKWKAKYSDPVAPKTSELPELPEGWCWATTDQLFWFVTSGSRGWAKYYSDSGAAFIRIGNLDHDSISLDLSDIQHVLPPDGAEGTRTRVAPGDVLVSITADVGMIALVRDEIEEAYINQHVSLARPVTCFCLPYLAWFLASQAGGQRQFAALQRGATKVGLGLDDIRSVNVPLPPFGEQLRIVEEVERCLSIASACSGILAVNDMRLRRARQSILKWAFEGRLVDQDPTDEPASVLLERIRAERASSNGTPPRRARRSKARAPKS